MCIAQYSEKECVAIIPIDPIKQCKGEVAERRRAPRFDVQWPVTISTTTGLKRRATISNVSQSGIQILCDSTLIALALPAFHRPKNHIPVPIKLEFYVRNLRREKVTVEVGVIFVKRQTNKIFSMGVQFQSFENGSDKALTRAIQELSSQSF